MNTVHSEDGTPIAFDTAGRGSPLIVVDGALCHRAMGPSRRLADLLAPRFTVFIYDRRGRGESGDTAPYAVEREVEDIQALIEVAGGSAYLFGISSGAALALEAARRDPAVKTLALYEPPFIVDDSRPPVPKDHATKLTELTAADRRGDAVKLFLRQVGAPAIFVALMRLTPVWSKLKAVAHTLPYDAAIVGEYQAGAPLPANRWASVAMPTLVVAGGKSPPGSTTAHGRSRTRSRTPSTARSQARLTTS